MNKQRKLIALSTLIQREVRRFLRIWPQTLLPSSVTTTMYFIIFGKLLGCKLGNMGGVSYINYLIPGLIMMAVITNSYSNVASSLFGNKFQRSIEELIISPMPSWVILDGFIIGGVLRGLLVGLIVTLLSLLFTKINIVHPCLTILIVILTSILFSLAGFMNALLANNFDDISIIPIFVLTPLTYLGGVFYNINLLPYFWKNLSLINPIFYMVNTFRYGILGISDIVIGKSLVAIIIFILLLYIISLKLLIKGKGIHS
ncbi:Inner membrane transport permease YadH [Candidatus Portiera aleyrodidarum]|uniref:Transport permease protein n=1 Tax=Candidatus Portiera aleyrodidarum TV TaxID=1297582 RepID=A0A8D3X7J8_9GAMM|nr:ABC transporter permease [Candidatus Portiera aleyrodidarum]AGI27160.1 ABC-type polysaccharide/polyol phosphate export systems, permease component [Candidatus Portiera aleyrodidarum TV]CEI59138.1 Inner membrane transport permease YadH [Candidatus Portiera aleyrodidarum]